MSLRFIKNNFQKNIRTQIKQNKEKKEKYKKKKYIV